ncbi:hypothetical protein AVEN_172725-1 [Araneus ventricosus]|uniref:Uncharacterized protein n=1 Tax=Araneus ventricosus TaxID=182803 RepID=A0A4Y2CCY3_ARAVE|nr:hypothetical protein AVEN_172725-1 [Araneus ventricosus]
MGIPKTTHMMRRFCIRKISPHSLVGNNNGDVAHLSSPMMDRTIVIGVVVAYPTRNGGRGTMPSNTVPVLIVAAAGHAGTQHA